MIVSDIEKDKKNNQDSRFADPTYQTWLSGRKPFTPKLKRPKTRRATTTPPAAWIKSIVSALYYGKLKPVGTEYTSNGSVVKLSPRPVRKKEFYLGKKLTAKSFAEIPNYLLQDHWANAETLYYVSDGSPKARWALLMLDIDVHKTGSTTEAKRFAKILESHFPGLYWEPSTNGRGIHCYLLLDKLGLDAGSVNNLALNRLQPFLRALVDQHGINVELVEIKGTAPVVSFDYGRVAALKCGTLAKIPRNVSRFHEWESTAKITVAQLLGNRFDVEVSPAKIVAYSSRAGSTSGAKFGKDVLSRLDWVAEGLKPQLAALGAPNQLNNGRSRLITPLDYAIALMIHSVCPPNSDGTMPYASVREVWQSLYHSGAITRAWNSSKYTAIRNWFSEQGQINWTDNRFWCDGGDGKRTKGIACKFTVNADLLALYDLSTQQTASFRYTCLSNRGNGQNLRPKWSGGRDQINEIRLRAAEQRVDAIIFSVAA